MVLFTSENGLPRAENLRAVWDAYGGPKRFERGFRAIIDAPRRGFAVAICDTMEPYVPDKRGMQMVFIGHGITGGKLFAYDQPRKYLDNRARGQFDWAVCASTQTRSIVAHQLGIDESRVLPLGMPRTDTLVNSRKGDGRTILATARRAYLYAPTFRAGYERAPLPVIDWARLDSMMEDGELLAVKRHYFTDKLLVDGEYAHIVELDNIMPSGPLIVDCDVLCTDFSSIVFGAYVAGKPTVIATDFAAGYLEARGMYMGYPGGYGSRAIDIQGNEAAWLGLLRAAAAQGMDSRERDIRAYVSDACDGQSARRVADFVGSLAGGHAVP